MSDIQAILFDKKKWTKQSSHHWIRTHNFKPIKPVHITDRYYRYRLVNPYPHYRYITETIDNGIKFILYY